MKLKNVETKDDFPLMISLYGKKSRLNWNLGRVTYE